MPCAELPSKLELVAGPKPGPAQSSALCPFSYQTAFKGYDPGGFWRHFFFFSVLDWTGGGGAGGKEESPEALWSLEEEEEGGGKG